MSRMKFKERVARQVFECLFPWTGCCRVTFEHRLAESKSGDVKTLKGKTGEKRLRVGDYRVRFTEEHPDSLRIHAVRNRKDAYR